MAATLWSARPAAPRAADIPTTEFSEVRASPVLERLAQTKRVAGSAEADAALRFLEAEMRAIPGLGVEVQHNIAYALGPYSGPSIYTARNIVARLPGTELAHESVLVAAHYDSAIMSHGAADDALSCAAIVEAARCLAAGPRPSRTIVFLLDETEELGLFGAQGFLRDPRSSEVVTFLNLEAAGCRGRPLLFQSGPGDPWFASAYARAAPHPHGTVLGQDVFQSGVIPSDTDFRVYRDDGQLRGLDVALYRDGWGYHTTRDRLERLEPGSLQEMGDNTVGVLRELASMEIPSGHIDAPAVYYDILGMWMLAYASPAAWLLALVALASLAHALWVAGRERGIGAFGFLRGTAWVSAAVVAALILTVALASLLDVWRDGVSGWYARPWLAAVAYGVPSAVAVLLVLRVAVLRSTATPITAATRLAGGVGIAFAVLLTWATWSGVGSGYLALWWVVGATAAVRLASRGRLATAIVVGGAFPALLTVQAADALLATFVPIAGRMYGPMEHVIALLAAVPVAASLLLPGALVATVPPSWGRWTLRIAAVAGAVACVGVAAWSPYTEDRPRRVDCVYSRLPGADVGRWQSWPLQMQAEGEFPAAEFVPLGDAELPVGSPEGVVRRVRVRLQPNGATGVRLWFDHGTMARISAGDGAQWVMPQAPKNRTLVMGPDQLAFVAPPRGGLDLTFDLRVESVEFQVRTWHVAMPAAVQAELDALPAWVTPEASAEVFSKERL